MAQSGPLSREECRKLLADAAETLGRYPKRSDFSDAEVAAVKGWFGPWGRALEAAGVKPARTEDRLEKNREKRARAKQRQRAAHAASRKEGERNAKADDSQTSKNELKNERKP